MISPLRLLGRRLARHLSRPRPHLARPPTSPHEQVSCALRRGDVLLVEGTSRFATAIRYLTQSTWSHAALCVGEARGGAGPLLCDVDVNDGVRRVPMSEFADLHTRICRPVGLSDSEVDAVCAFMLDRIGYAYDLKNVFDLARFLVRTPPLPEGMKRRMIALGSGAPTRAICSTLLAQAFGSIRYPILPEVELHAADAPGARQARAEILHIRHHSLYTPRDFDTSPFFRIVKPRLEQAFDFHRLVWSDQGADPVDWVPEA